MRIFHFLLLNLFANIKIYYTAIEKNFIDLVIYVEEKPRLSKFSIRGVKKSEADDIREHINLRRGNIITDYLLKNTEYYIKDFFADKNFFDAQRERLGNLCPKIADGS